MEIIIPAVPVPKGRPKFSTFGGHVRAITPKATREYEALVRMFAQMAMDGPPIEGPVYIRAEFHFERPRSQWRKRNPVPAGLCDRKPDLDNLIKSLLDGLEGPCFAMDSQVAWIAARKLYAAQGDPARTVVVIEPVTPVRGEV